MTEPTCAERLPEHLAGRLQDFERINKQIQSAYDDNADVDQDEAHAERDQYPSSITTKTVVRIELAGGGPADYFDLTFDHEDDDTPERIEYHFADWGDHASRDLEGAEFDAAWEFLQSFTEGAMVR